MRTGQEIADWLVDNIAHVYSRPQMYACTQSELDSHLRQMHFTWAYLFEREEDCRRLELQHGLKSPESAAMRPDGYFDRVKHHELLAALALVVQVWRKIDQGLGLEIPNRYPQFPAPS